MLSNRRSAGQQLSAGAGVRPTRASWGVRSPRHAAPPTEQGQSALTAGPRCAPASGTVDGPDAPGRGDGFPTSGRDQQEAVLVAGLLQGPPPPGPRMGTQGSVVFWLRHVWVLVGMLHTP